MKSAALLTAGFVLLASIPCPLGAQTRLGQSYAQVGVAQYEPVTAGDSGTGVAGRFNLSVLANVDLYLSGALASGAEGNFDWSNERIAGGITYHWAMKKVRPFVSLEAGYDSTEHTLTRGGVSHSSTEDSVTYAGAAGVEIQIDDTFTLAPITRYEIYYDVPGGDWFFGAELNVRVSERFSLAAALLACSSANASLSLAARFQF